MKTAFTLVLLLTIQVVQSQQGQPSRYAGLISADSLRAHLHIIAGADMQGRETATAGQRRAAAYIQKQFEVLGLLPGWQGQYQQFFPVFVDSVELQSLRVNNKRFKPYTDFWVSPNSKRNMSMQASEIVFAGYGRSDSMHNDYRDVDAAGKIVLVIPEQTKKRKKKAGAPDFYTLQNNAKKNGAIALLMPGKGFPRRPSPDKSAPYISEPAEQIPDTYIISDTVLQYILGRKKAIRNKKLRSGNASRIISVNAQLEFRINHHIQESSNVLGYIPGTGNKKESLIITAHYDHLGMNDTTIYYGADDDGSGTVSVLELARAFSTAAAEGNRPARSIVFMTVSGEEEGLWGSSYYAAHPAFPLDKTAADLNIDMIGRVEGSRKMDDSLHYIFVVGDNKLSSELRGISEGANSKGPLLKLDYKFNASKDPQRIYYRSDHYNFAKNGVPVIFYFGGLHEDYHRPTDTPDKINYPLLQERARLIFYTAWDMANRDEMVRRDIPLD